MPVIKAERRAVLSRRRKGRGRLELIKARIETRQEWSWRSLRSSMRGLCWRIAGVLGSVIGFYFARDRRSD